MPSTRPSYPPEFQRQIVELVCTGRSPEELAKEFELTAQSIRTWVEQPDANEGHSDAVTSTERAELAALFLLFGYRRLTIRSERKASHFATFLSLAATLTCFKRLAKLVT